VYVDSTERPASASETLARGCVLQQCDDGMRERIGIVGEHDVPIWT
jgi:hypothetical protein